MFRDSVRRTLEGFGKRAAGPALRQALVELGATMTDVPEDLGGLGGQGIETALILTEFGRFLVAEPFTNSVIHAGALLASTGVAADLLDGLIDGSHLTVLASAEPEGSGDALHVATVAEKKAGSYHLRGLKSVVIGAPRAQTILITARIAGKDPQGIALFRIDAIDADRKVACETLDGYTAADILLDGLVLPETALLVEDCGAALARATDAALIATCAEGLGAMEAALELTNDYLKTRKQFGVAIGSFQALQHRMADAFVMVEQARSSLYAALAAWAHGGDEMSRVIAGTKSLIGRTGRAMTADMVQLHGGIGMTEEYDIGHYYRRLLAIEARLGNSDHHLRRVAGL